ncbi:MAG: TonB-dependent receptor [Bacteroidia bacterium]|nr:TonB-dependent receptor [Bacteroidia bacterium]
MKKIILVLCALMCSMAYSQSIKVIDEVTRQPIPGVVLYCNQGNNNCSTNANGNADISTLTACDTIITQHISYKQKRILLSQLKEKNYTIELSETKISLNEITVAANRWEEKKSENPIRMEKMKKKEIDFQNPQTTADLLGAGTNVYIQKSQQAGGSPMLRGFATNRVMLVIDGIRMNNAIFRSGNVQNVIALDANAIGEAEVLFGPGAVMYGSDAIGGVMDFHTLSAKLSDTSKLKVSGNAMARFSTANKENTGHMDLNFGLKRIAFLTSFSYSQYDDLYAGTNGGDSVYLRHFYQEVKSNKDTQVVNIDPSLQVNSKYKQFNFMQKIAFTASEKLKIDYAFHYSKSSDAPRYDRLITDANSDGTLDFSEWYYGPQIWHMQRLAFHHAGNTKAYTNLRVIAAYQYFEESRHDRRFNASGNVNSSAARLRHQYEKLDAYSLNIDLDKKISEKTQLFYGAEYVLNYVQSVANRVNVYSGTEQKINSRYPNGSTWQTAGVYINAKHRLSEKFIINAGLRYSYYSIVAKFDTTLFPYPLTQAKMNNGALNGSLGFVYMPMKNWQLYLNTSTGFRSPNIDDIGKVFDSQPGIVVVPNPTLKPEYAYSADIGTAFTIGNVLKMDASFYYTYLTNALVRRPFNLNGKDSIDYNGQMSQVQALQNTGHAFVYGIQSNTEVYFGYGLSLLNSITWQNGQEYNGDSSAYYPLSHTTPLFGKIQLSYARKKIRTSFYVNYNGEMKYEDLPLSERNEPYVYARTDDGKPYVPSWYTLNFKLGIYFNKRASLNFGVENIADVLYRPYASGISAPGRNFYLSLRLKL